MSVMIGMTRGLMESAGLSTRVRLAKKEVHRQHLKSKPPAFAEGFNFAERGGFEPPVP